ncbi:MAG: hypothetical protein HPY64_10970 [Anaerolineae bacterium]|nr:hypothetical protein [Anaerolineae bacterium]
MHRLPLLYLLLLLLLLPAPLAAQGSPAALSTLEQVLTTPLPIRDPLDLARRLRGVESLPAPPAAPVQRWQVGDVALFWADNVETDEKFRVKATLRYVTDVVYMWVENGAEVDQAALERSADVFSTHTYPLLRTIFGQEASPGVDGDPRLHILHAANLGAGTAAYFSAESLYPAEIKPGSNEREMVFVNLDTMRQAIGTGYYDAVLAHEFQHMIHWNNDANEDAWLDEGSAELAALLAGLDQTGFAPQFLRDPGVQLTTWPENESTLPHYGAAFLFAAYFYERFGEAGTRLLVAQQANGMAGVDAALQTLSARDPATGQPLTSTVLFADWTVANLLNGSGDTRYGYTRLSRALGAAQVQETITAYPATLTRSAPQYSACYIALQHTGPGRLRLDFSGAETVRLVPTGPFSGARMWYSNRGDTTDSRLTRRFDLRGVSRATLEFQTWYDIEHLWDYAYVMVSVDDGATWTPLPGLYTTTADPHGNAYGPAYTGDSGYTSGDATPIWLRERVDLTPFAGQEVLLRFELITDESVNTTGMVIDDVRIPEIGYFDDFEAGPGGWESEGWLYIDNILPQEWIVQLVTRGQQTAVTRLAMPGDGAHGAWEFDVGGPAGEATLIISPIAPLTTEPGYFTITLTRVDG